jgi:hypothetical protein
LQTLALGVVSAPAIGGSTMERAFLLAAAAISLCCGSEAKAEHPVCAPPAAASGQIVAVRGVLEAEGRVARIVVGGRCMLILLPDAADESEDPSASPLREWNCEEGRIVMMKGRFHVLSMQTEWLEPINFSCR